MTKYECKVINKQLIATRLVGGSIWKIEPNIFEVIRSYLLWNYGEQWLPHTVPYIYEDEHPNLYDWYMALSKPNSPYKRVLKVSEQEFKEWVLGLDLTKPVDKDVCNRMFEIVSSTTKRDVDAVAIAENENLTDV